MKEYRRGDKVRGKYLGRYPFRGRVYRTDLTPYGEQNLYVTLDEPVRLPSYGEPLRWSLLVRARNVEKVQ